MIRHNNTNNINKSKQTGHVPFREINKQQIDKTEHIESENQQTKKNLKANKGIDIEKLYKQRLNYFIKGYE